MQHGDLVHIPQDVSLWNYTDNGSMNVVKTEKPTTGIFLREDATNTLRVYVQARIVTGKQKSRS